MGKIETEIHGHWIEVDRTVDALEALCDRLRQPVMDQNIMVLVPENRDQLKQLISMGSFFNNRRVLLVLPDKEPATISSGHRLYPRFVTCSDSAFSDLVSVLKNLIHRERYRY